MKTAPLPRITVVTPSFNQGHFIEQTIRSVLGQDYPNLEYIIIDGGSTDSTLEVIRRYESRLAYWVSEKDRGQAHAINKGFRRATGDVIAWLNSDDLYQPGILHRVANEFRQNPEAGWIVGRVEEFHPGVSEAPQLFEQTLSRNLVDWVTRQANIHQPGAFWRRELYSTVGELKEDWHFGFDAEFWCRLVARGHFPLEVDSVFARFRLHPDSKTCAQAVHFVHENIRLAEAFRGQIPKRDHPLLHSHLSYLRAHHAMLLADNFMRKKDRFGATGVVLKAMASHPTLIFKPRLYRKMCQAIFSRARPIPTA